MSTRYVLHNGTWVPDYTVGDGLGTRIARGLWKLGVKQKGAGCGCRKRQETLDRWTSRRKVNRPPQIIAGGSGTEEAICDDPNVLFCDNFESRALGDVRTTGTLGANLGGKTLGWGWDQSPGQNIIDVGCQDGGRCLQQVYPDLSTPKPQDNGGGGFIGSNLFAANRTVFFRMWIHHPSNWVPGFGGKTNYVADQFGRIRQEIGFFGSSYPVAEGDHGGMGNLIPNMNLGSATFNPGTWQCLEYRVTLETTTGVLATGVGGTMDGYYQAWIDDIQIADYPNTQFGISVGAHPAIDNVLVSSYWNCLCDRGLYQCDNVVGSFDGARACIDPYNAHPLMVRLVDRVVVATGRIGCGNSTVAQPPLPPSPIPVPLPATYVTISTPTSSPTFYTRTTPL